MWFDKELSVVGVAAEQSEMLKYCGQFCTPPLLVVMGVVYEVWHFS